MHGNPKIGTRGGRCLMTWISMLMPSPSSCGIKWQTCTREYVGLMRTLQPALTTRWLHGFGVTTTVESMICSSEARASNSAPAQNAFISSAATQF
jgi:hypothetical protein